MDVLFRRANPLYQENMNMRFTNRDPAAVTITNTEYKFEIILSVFIYYLVKRLKKCNTSLIRLESLSERSTHLFTNVQYRVLVITKSRLFLDFDTTFNTRFPVFLEG